MCFGSPGWASPSRSSGPWIAIKGGLLKPTLFLKRSIGFYYKYSCADAAQPWLTYTSPPDGALAGQETGLMCRHRISKARVILKTDRPVVAKKPESDEFTHLGTDKRTLFPGAVIPPPFRCWTLRKLEPREQTLSHSLPPREWWPKLQRPLRMCLLRPGAAQNALYTCWVS